MVFFVTITQIKKGGRVGKQRGRGKEEAEADFKSPMSFLPKLLLEVPFNSLKITLFLSFDTYYRFY